MRREILDPSRSLLFPARHQQKKPKHGIVSISPDCAFTRRKIQHQRRGPDAGHHWRQWLIILSAPNRARRFQCGRVRRESVSHENSLPVPQRRIASLPNSPQRFWAAPAGVAQEFHRIRLQRSRQREMRAVDCGFFPSAAISAEQYVPHPEQQFRGARTGGD